MGQIWAVGPILSTHALNACPWNDLQLRCPHQCAGESVGALFKILHPSEVLEVGQ